MATKVIMSKKLKAEWVAYLKREGKTFAGLTLKMVNETLAEDRKLRGEIDE